MNKNFLTGLYFIISLLLIGCIDKAPVSNNEPHKVPHADSDSAQYISKDSIRHINDTTYFRSKDMLHDEYNGNYYYYSQQSVHIEWPEQLAECSDIRPLQNALINRAFSPKFVTSNIDSTVNKFTGTALFLEIDEAQVAIPTDKSQVKPGTNSTYSGVVIRRTMTSPTLVTFTIRNEDYQGGAHGYYATNHVNFDKKSCTVFDSTTTFITDQKAKLLSIINKYIDQKNRTYNHTEEIPDFYVDTEHIIFVFPPYAIACYAEGIVEISIPYESLKTCLTAAFLQVIAHADTFERTTNQSALK